MCIAVYIQLHRRNDGLSSDFSPFRWRGVIEGFYGTYYTFPERNDLIRFIGRHGFHLYLYGPKNDRQHRVRWWNRYPAGVMDEFADTLSIAHEAGVDFGYTISFGRPFSYASPDDFAVITAKLRGFFDRGCRTYGVLLDDLGSLSNESELGRFTSAAEAHADFIDRLHDWLRMLDDTCTLFVCPPEYFGSPPFPPYLHELGCRLDSDVELFYTGPTVVSRTITLADCLAFAEAAGRLPVIWDNYPTNDLHMRPEMHLGPLRGRDPRLYEGCRGYVANVMNEAEASKIPLLTIAEYLRDPRYYDPAAAWERALHAVADHGCYQALRHLAENSLGSVLDDDEAPYLTRLASEMLSALRSGERVGESAAERVLSLYLDAIDEAGYELKNRMRNLALRHNLLPWIEALEAQLWMGRSALLLLDAVDKGADSTRLGNRLDEMVAEVQHSSKRIGGRALLELAAYAQERAGSDAARAPSAYPVQWPDQPGGAAGLAAGGGQ